MKLLFVGAALLVSVLRTDAQGYAASSFGNYNPQLPDSVANVPLPPQPQGQAAYPVNAYYGNPPPPPPPVPSSRFLGDLLQAASTFASNQVNAAQDMLGQAKQWFDNQSQRRYPPNPQNQYNVAPPMGSSQVVYTSGYNGAPPPPHAFSSQVGVAPSSLFNGLAQPPPPPPQSFPAAGGQAVYSYNGPPPPLLPVSSQVTYYSGSYGAPPPPPPPVGSQAVYSPGSYGAPPPPPGVSSQAGAPSNSYSGPPLPGASIQVGGSSDNNNGPSPANSQPFNAKLQAPPQNVL